MIRTGPIPCRQRRSRGGDEATEAAGRKDADREAGGEDGSDED